MTTEIVKEFYKHLANSNMQGAFELLHQDFKLVQAPSLPYGGTYIGTGGVTTFFGKFFEYWQSFKSVDVEYFETGEKVFATSKIIGTTRNNQNIEMKMIQLFIVQEDRLVSAEPYYFDTAELSETKNGI
jgi:ketosteroid isomerase-like protein